MFAALLAAPAVADGYVVDDSGGPGVDFTDLPAAVAAAAPGDVLLVQPGFYSGFATTKGIAVLAQSGSVEVTSMTRFANLPAGEVARLVGVELSTLQLINCQGVVVLDGVTVGGSNVNAMEALKIVSCVDVRVIGSFAGYGTPTPAPPGGNPSLGAGLRVLGARVELVDSQLKGPAGSNGSPGNDGGPGGHGAAITTGSRVHLVLVQSEGGKGGDGSPLCLTAIYFAGDGGDGAIVYDSSTLLAMGTPSLSKLIAGAGGSGNPGCILGGPGAALNLQANAYVRHSGQTISGGTLVDGSSTLDTPALLDPYMERVGTPLVGEQVQFNVFGEAGDVVTLFLGRNAVVQPLPGVLIEKLTSEERAFARGSIPAGGFATFAFNLPPAMASGFTFYAQARVMRGTEELRTNSTPIVVR